MLLGKKGQYDDFLKDTKSFGLKEISKEEAVSKFDILDSSKVENVSYRPDVFDLDTDLFFQNFLKEFKENKGSIFTNSKVDKIRYDGKKWIISTSKNEFDAKLLVNASGAWVDEIAKMAGIKPIGFTPFKRSIAE